MSGVATYYVGNSYEVSGSTTTKYYYPSTALRTCFGSQRVAMKVGSTTYYLHTDHLSSTSVVADSGGALVTRQTYYAFGSVRTLQGSASPTDYGFTGQKFDASDALMYYGARYYDPLLSRFTQPDTIVPGAGNPQNFNRYSYVLNNPLRYTDPTGHFLDPGCGCDGDPTNPSPDPNTPPPVLDPVDPVQLPADTPGDPGPSDPDHDPHLCISFDDCQHKIWEIEANGSQPYHGWLHQYYSAEAVYWLQYGAADQDIVEGHVLDQWRALLINGFLGRDAALDAGVRSGGGDIMQIVIGMAGIGIGSLRSGGSTGRTIPNNMTEQLALEQAQSDPASGLPLDVKMTDPRWPASEGWTKMAQNINGVEIHYAYNPVTGEAADFKFK